MLALTTFDLDEHIYAAVQAGASGFLLKDVSPDDLVHAVRVVARGDAMLAPALTRRLLDRFASAPLPGSLPTAMRTLTERELAVARLVARGLSTKLNLRDRVQIAVLAYESGLVQAGQS